MVVVSAIYAHSSLQQELGCIMSQILIKLSTFFPPFSGISYFLLTLVSPGKYLKIDFQHSSTYVSPPIFLNPVLATPRLIIAFES